ncbi:hypothetical protein EJB05_55124 [Eragrostis curvula]|uniref:Strictosidine synthase conserved region domain-containing protein n=1 Tax=Eragrostis curvula TaxID=38414 RepID=A0A5J9SKM6_9POAL|nr:hypothetical protein EJB05_55124 [Eragrostis curvula]
MKALLLLRDRRDALLFRGCSGRSRSSSTATAAGRTPAIADGRVVRWMGEEAGWETFAVMDPDWSEKVCANGVTSTTSNQHNKEQFCGRPIGLRFHRETGVLYIADAYYGLMVIGRSGGMATSFAREAGGSE